MNARRTLLFGAVSFALSACSKSLSGTYTAQGNLAGTAPYKAFIFNSNKVEIEMLVATIEADYVVEDDKVKATAAGQTLVFPIDEQGCLTSSTGGKFCKK